MARPARAVSAVSVVLLVSGCASVRAATENKCPTGCVEANAPTDPTEPPPSFIAEGGLDRALPLFEGEPAPHEGVLLSIPLAAEKAKNCAAWETTGAACLKQLEQVRNGPDRLILIGGGVGAFVVGAITGAIVVHQIKK